MAWLFRYRKRVYLSEKYVVVGTAPAAIFVSTIRLCTAWCAMMRNPPMGRNIGEAEMPAFPPIWSAMSFVLMIMRIAGCANVCVACHESANGEAESGCSGGLSVCVI